MSLTTLLSALCYLHNVIWVVQNFRHWVVLQEKLSELSLKKASMILEKMMILSDFLRPVAWNAAILVWHVAEDGINVSLKSSPTATGQRPQGQFDSGLTWPICKNCGNMIEFELLFLFIFPKSAKKIVATGGTFQTLMSLAGLQTRI